MEAIIYKENKNFKNIVVAVIMIMFFISAILLRHGVREISIKDRVIPMSAWSDTTWTRTW